MTSRAGPLRAGRSHDADDRCAAGNRRRRLIGGEWRRGSGAVLKPVDPASGDAICRIHGANGFDVDVAVQAGQGGAVLMATEHSPGRRRGFYGSWPQVGVPMGLILPSAVFLPLSSLSGEALNPWGWRVPFLLSALLVLAGLFIR